MHFRALSIFLILLHFNLYNTPSKSKSKEQLFYSKWQYFHEMHIQIRSITCNDKKKFFSHKISKQNKTKNQPLVHCQQCIREKSYPNATFQVLNLKLQVVTNNSSCLFLNFKIYINIHFFLQSLSIALAQAGIQILQSV